MIVVEANTSIELKVGGSSRIEAARITIKAPEIAAQSDANTVMTLEGALVKIN